MNVQKAPMYQVSYQRSGQTFQSKEALFANWTPDTLDKTLYDEDAKVGINYTKLRNHSVGEALKETLSDVGPCLFLVAGMAGAVGMIYGAMAEYAGHAGAAMIGGLSGAGLGVGLMALAGVVEYRGMRSDAGQTTTEFSGYAYRERTDKPEVKLVRGDSLSCRRREDGSIAASAVATATGYFETRDLGSIPHYLVP